MKIVILKRENCSESEVTNKTTWKVIFFCLVQILENAKVCLLCTEMKTGERSVPHQLGQGTHQALALLLRP